jgi:hypothetical protein
MESEKSSEESAAAASKPELGIFDVPITHNDFQTFLAEKWPLAFCPLCRANDWHVSGLSDDSEAEQIAFLAFERGSDRNYLSAANIPGTILMCKNCGNTIFFGRSVVGAWKLEQLAKGNNNG